MGFVLNELLSSYNPNKPLPNPRVSQSQAIDRIAMHMTMTELRHLVRSLKVTSRALEIKYRWKQMRCFSSQLIVLRSILSDIRDAETEQIRKLLGSIPTETKLAEMQRNSVECNSAVNPDTQQNSTASSSFKKKPKGLSRLKTSSFLL